MGWETVERPGQFGSRKTEIFRGFDEKYGKGKWRVAWQWGNDALTFEEACKVYEDGYYEDSFRREQLWKELVATAKEVIESEESDIISGSDYGIQKGPTHLNDIAIRNAVQRRGWKFRGRKIIKIRDHPEWSDLDSGKVPFQKPEMILKPALKGWWEPNSVEDFYQSNKVIQVKGFKNKQY